MSSPLVNRGWVKATVPIDNPYGESGTGFLVYRSITAQEGRVFLVTNKHVVCKDPAKRAATSHLKCHFNKKGPDGKPGIIAHDIQLTRPDGSKRFREHPDADTDVYALDVTDEIIANPDLEKAWVTYDLFADAGQRKELDITAGEDVVIIGYPMGLRQGDSNFPLIRQGLLATTIGTPMKDKVRTPVGGLRDRTLRAFLIDGATIPGSSGSPVILKPIVGRVQGNTIRVDVAPLGIIAETKYIPIELKTGVSIPGFAGLGLAFDVETIKETIEMFFP
jgi:Trypsin-like peptidase domain